MKTYNLATVAGSALALLVTLGTPAVAGDWNNGAGSVKDSYGTDAIAVPAPVPSPDYAARWYLRGDVGIGFGASPSIGRCPAAPSR